MEVIAPSYFFVKHEVLIPCDCGCSILKIECFNDEKGYTFTWYGSPFQHKTSPEAHLEFDEMDEILKKISKNDVEQDLPLTLTVNQIFFTVEKARDGIYLTIGKQDNKGRIDWDIYMAPSERDKFINMMTKWLEEDYVNV